MIMFALHLYSNFCHNPFANPLWSNIQHIISMENMDILDMDGTVLVKL